MDKKTIVVAVDGSSLSESAVPYALLLSEALGANVLAIGVCQTGHASTFASTQMAAQMARAEREYFKQYLTGLRENLAGQGRVVETELRDGDPVNEVLNLLNERSGQYLVLATHGRSGLNRWRYGSVAGRLIHEASAATLVVGPKVLERKQAPAVQVHRILVPLDGSPLAEEALRAASELAQKLGAGLVLARDVQWASQVYPSFDPVTLNREMDASAVAYLDEVRRKTAGVVETKVLRGYPADLLIQLVEDAKIDLVVMTSHSRAGLARAILGSVADRMLQCSAPVLLIRPASQAPVSVSPGEHSTPASQAANGPLCQSCGMPLTAEDDFGTLANGARASEYCHFCFSDGEFTQPDATIATMIERITPMTAEATGMTIADAQALLERTLPQLKRWQTTGAKLGS